MDDKTNTSKLFSTPGCNKYRLSVAELELLAQTSEFEISNSFSPRRKKKVDSDEEDGDPPRLVPPIFCPKIEDCEATDEAGLEEDILNHSTEDNTEILTDFLSPNSVPTPDEIDQDADTSVLSDKRGILTLAFSFGSHFLPKDEDYHVGVAAENTT